MTRTPEEAIAWARNYVGKYGWDNLCLSFVRQSFGVDYVGDWPAAERMAGVAWDRARFKHRETDPTKIPRGVPVFFELQTVADHVVLSTGDGDCLTNDFVANGRIDYAKIGDIARRWGPLLGWTEDLVGNRVYTPKPPVPPMPPKPDWFELDVMAFNAYVKNPRPVAGVQALVSRVRKTLNRRPDVIACQEWMADVDQIGGAYRVLSRKSSRNAVLVKRWFDDIDAEWVKGSEGEGDGVNRHDRDMCVVRYTKRGVKCGAISFHAPYLGQPRAELPPIADKYKKYGNVLMSQVGGLLAEGRVVHLGGDNNARNDGEKHWPFAIYRRLENAGLHVDRRGLDLVAYKGATPRRGALFPSLAGTGSNHGNAVVSATKVRKP